MELPLDQVHMQLSGLEDDLTYYIQVNLVAPQNVLVYGHTLKFNLPDLPFGQLELEKPSDTYQATPSTLVIIILAAAGVAIIMTIGLCTYKWMQQRKQPKNRFRKRSVIHAKSCCNYTEWCYGQKETDEMFQKTNFNGFDTGIDLIRTLCPFSPIQ